MESKKRCIDYWMKIFRELNSDKELEKVLTNISGNTIDSLINEKDKSDYASTLLDKKINEILIKNDSEFEKYIPYYGIYIYIINEKLDEFISKISLLPIIGDVDNFVKVIIKQLLDKLFECSYRVLILEINVLRMNGTLIGNSHEERAKYFTDVMLKDKKYVGNIYNEYYSLVEVLRIIAEEYFEFVLEIVTNTKNEWDEISKKIFNDKEIKLIESVTTELGDTHKGGKTVATIKFSDGCKLIYKPRTLRLEEGYQSLLGFFEKNIDNEVFKIKKAKIHTINNYGWMEFIQYEECKNKSDIEKFYIRSGYLLFILYLLNSVDFHHENLIAHGSYPMLVDLESIFNPKINLYKPDEDTGIIKANEVIKSSVQSISLLPSTISMVVDGKQINMDFGGLSGDKEQISPFKSLTIENLNSDEVKVVKKNKVIKPKINNPIMNGKIINSYNYLNEIKSGFQEIYKWVLNHKEQVENEVEKIFKNEKSRFIFRSTMYYVNLLNIGTHPDFLREKAHRKVLFHKVNYDVPEKFTEILRQEYLDLLRNDIPYFEASISKNMAYSSRNKEIPNVFEETPLESVLKKIKTLSNEDLYKQMNFIEMSYFNKHDRVMDVTNIKFSECSCYNNTNKEWLETAIKIGDFIIDNSIEGINKYGDKTRHWIGPSLEGIEEDSWKCDILGCDLYNGISGIGLFLAYLGEVANEEKYKKVAEEVMNSVMSFIKDLDKENPYLSGAFMGISGYFYVLNKVSIITNNYKIKQFIIEHIDLLEKLIDGDETIDCIGGSCGALGVLLSIYENIEPEYKGKIYDIAVKNYKNIIKHTVEEEKGISWRGKYSNSTTGFAHGNAGYIAFMYKLYTINKDESILKNVKKALVYERSLYSEKDENWFSTAERNTLSNGWCHGAPGILLSMAMLKKYGYNDPKIEDEINTAIKTTCEKGIGNNPTFCHGDLGNLTILQFVASVNKDEELMQRVYSTYSELFTKVLSKRWDKFDLRCTKSFSLLIGLTGFGYSMIKNYKTLMVPNFLALE